MRPPLNLENIAALESEAEAIVQGYPGLPRVLAHAIVRRGLRLANIEHFYDTAFQMHGANYVSAKCHEDSGGILDFYLWSERPMMKYPRHLEPLWDADRDSILYLEVSDIPF